MMWRYTYHTCAENDEIKMQQQQCAHKQGALTALCLHLITLDTVDSLASIAGFCDSQTKYDQKKMTAYRHIRPQIHSCMLM